MGCCHLDLDRRLTMSMGGSDVKFYCIKNLFVDALITRKVFLAPILNYPATVLSSSYLTFIEPKSCGKRLASNTMSHGDHLQHKNLHVKYNLCHASSLERKPKG